MSNEANPPNVVSFGPFQVDLRTQELKKHDMRLRLPRQSFQILAMLLRQPGALVAREELQQALWPADTHVDFERGVNAAVNRLRDVLGDSADNPTFIETLPRRGYRFIAPIVKPATSEVSDSPATLGRMADYSALTLRTSPPSSIRSGKWTRAARIFTRFLLIGKPAPSTAVEIGRRMATTITSRPELGKIKLSGCCPSVVRSFAGTPLGPRD